MASAVAMTLSSAGLAVCYVRAEPQETQDQTTSPSMPGPETLAFSVEFEFLEDDSAPAGSSNDKKRMFERILGGSQLLTPSTRHTLVLQSYNGAQSSLVSPFAAKAIEQKMKDYNTLEQVLRQKLTQPDTIIRHRASRSRVTAVKNLGLQIQQNPSPAPPPAAAAVAPGTPPSATTPRTKKSELRKAALKFLESERCISPNALDMFNSFLAKTMDDLADSFWLAMYDIQEQVKQQRKRKRSRGADPRGVYKANKRPATAAAAAAAAAVAEDEESSSDDDQTADVIEVSTPSQQVVTPAAAAGGGGSRRRRAVQAVDLTMDD